MRGFMRYSRHHQSRMTLPTNPGPALEIAEPGDSPVPRALTARSDSSVLAEFLPWLRPYVGRIALALALIVAAKLVNLCVPIALKQLVDRLNIAPNLLVLPVALLLAYGASRIGVTLFTELRQVVFADRKSVV